MKLTFPFLDLQYTPMAGQNKKLTDQHLIN